MNWDQAADRYVQRRRKMGHKFVVEGKWVAGFAEFAAARGDVHLRRDTVMAWLPDGLSPESARRRYAVIRDFALALAAEDGRHEVPLRHALGRARKRRPAPYLLSTEEIVRILAAAKAMDPPGSLDGLTYYTLFGLVASTGLRRAEAVNLRLGDVTMDGLLIREAKFGKSRLVPLSSSVQRHLRDYLRQRRRIGGGCDALFVSGAGRPLSLSTVDRVFLRLLRSTGIRKPGDRRGPSLHSLRHSFAVRSLEGCVSTDVDAVRRHAHALSVYLGHANVENTYWYLEATPTLLRRIATLAEGAYAGRSASCGG